ncbi:MAG: thiamine diphosphokinase [Prevotellaceae bacterium]|jgi:thiamine pyrophosphokinase|nr:thiamine diphosphokinase [Prevotellaceae bacterium]
MLNSTQTMNNTEFFSCDAFISSLLLSFGQELESNVILCNGLFPSHSIPLNLLNSAKKIICCDGAAEKLLHYGKTPFSIVGDMDSLPDNLKDRYKDRIFHDSEQENNDLTKAVQWCFLRHIHPLIVLGATGLREDHTIANIALLSDYNEYIDIIAVSDTGIFVPINCSKTFICRPQQQVSIFAITPDTKITSSGLKYEITERRFTNWNQGSLNETMSDTFKISIDAGRLIVFLEF